MDDEHRSIQDDAAESIKTIPFSLMAPLNRFASETQEIEFENGLKISRMSSEELTRLDEKYPVDKHIPSLQRLSLSKAKCAIMVNYEMSEAVIDDNVAIERANRLITALRLADRGEVAIPIFLSRPLETHRIVPLHGEIARSAPSSAPFGDLYKVTPPRDDFCKRFWEVFNPLLAALPESPAGDKLILALSRFNLAYERINYFDRLLDVIVGFEILYGTGAESTYRVSCRMSQLLGRSDEERTKIFELVRLGFRARNDIVHRGTTERIWKVAGEEWTLGKLIDRLRRLLAESSKATMLICGDEAMKNRCKNDQPPLSALTHLLEEASLSSMTRKDLDVMASAYDSLIWSDS